MTISRLLPSVFLIFSGAASLAAEPLALDQAISFALAHNRDLAAATLEAEAARGRVDQAGLRPNPALEAGAQTDLLTGNNGARKFDLGVNQAIPLGHRLREAQAVARVGIGAASAALADRQRRLAGEITRLYVELLALDQQVGLRDRQIRINAHFVELARARAQAGEVSVIEVNAAALEQARLGQERASLLAERSNQLQNLKALLGYSPEEDLQISGGLDALADTLNARGEGGGAAWNRPDLRLAVLAIDRIDAEQRLARAEAKGDLTLGATYGYDRQASGDPAHLLGVKMSLPLPLRNQNEGRLRELRAERTRAEREAAALEFRVTAEVATARVRSAQSRQIMESYRTAVLPLGEDAERSLVAAYQQGQVPLFQVIQAQQQHLALESGAVTAKAAYLLALADLQTATGQTPQLASAPAAEATP